MTPRSWYFNGIVFFCDVCVRVSHHFFHLSPYAINRSCRRLASLPSALRAFTFCLSICADTVSAYSTLHARAIIPVSMSLTYCVLFILPAIRYSVRSLLVAGISPPKSSISFRTLSQKSLFIIRHLARCIWFSSSHPHALSDKAGGAQCGWFGRVASMRRISRATRCTRGACAAGKALAHVASSGA